MCINMYINTSIYNIYIYICVCMYVYEYVHMSLWILDSFIYYMTCQSNSRRSISTSTKVLFEMCKCLYLCTCMCFVWECVPGNMYDRDMYKHLRSHLGVCVCACDVHRKIE